MFGTESLFIVQPNFTFETSLKKYDIDKANLCFRVLPLFTPDQGSQLMFASSKGKEITFPKNLLRLLQIQLYRIPIPSKIAS